MRKCAIMALLMAPGLALAAPVTTPWIAPGGGISGSSKMLAPGSTLNGKTLTQWGAAIDGNAASSAAAQSSANLAIPKSWIGADTTATVTGVPSLDAAGRVIQPSVTDVDMGTTPSAASPSSTDTTIYTLTPATSGTISLGSGGTSGRPQIVEVLIQNPTSGVGAVSFSGSISWRGGAVPVVSSVPGDKTFICFLTVDGGATYIGGI